MPLVIVWGKWESTDEPVKLSTRVKKGIQSAGGLQNDMSTCASGEGPVLGLGAAGGTPRVT